MYIYKHIYINMEIHEIYRDDNVCNGYNDNYS